VFAALSEANKPALLIGRNAFLKAFKATLRIAAVKKSRVGDRLKPGTSLIKKLKALP
jgi:hypothetical protein